MSVIDLVVWFEEHDHRCRAEHEGKTYWVVDDYEHGPALFEDLVAVDGADQVARGPIGPEQSSAGLGYAGRGQVPFSVQPHGEPVALLKRQCLLNVQMR